MDPRIANSSHPCLHGVVRIAPLEPWEYQSNIYSIWLMSPKIPIVISFIMHTIGTIIYLDIHILKLKNQIRKYTFLWYLAANIYITFVIFLCSFGVWYCWFLWYFWPFMVFFYYCGIFWLLWNFWTYVEFLDVCGIFWLLWYFLTFVWLFWYFLTLVFSFYFRGIFGLLWYFFYFCGIFWLLWYFWTSVVFFDSSFIFGLL